MVAEELETLNHLGVEIEPFGGASYLVRSLPAILGRENPAAALSEIVDGLAQRDDLVETTREARLVTLICKRAAIKGNSPLSMAEMQELVRRLEGCRSPRTCPHGRPTMVYLSSGELARQFGACVGARRRGDQQARNSTGLCRPGLEASAGFLASEAANRTG